MRASPEALRAIRTVARHLDDLCAQVVFVGGVVRGLMVTDPAVEGSRATKDVDVIVAGIATRADYHAVRGAQALITGRVPGKGLSDELKAPSTPWSKRRPAARTTFRAMRAPPKPFDSATSFHLRPSQKRRSVPDAGPPCPGPRSSSSRPLGTKSM
jgi:hypothetical protein